MEGDKPTRDNILRICRRHAFLEPVRKGGDTTILLIITLLQAGREQKKERNNAI